MKAVTFGYEASAWLRRLRATGDPLEIAAAVKSPRTGTPAATIWTISVGEMIGAWGPVSRLTGALVRIAGDLVGTIGGTHVSNSVSS
jgi:hypothetical protein